METLDDVVKDLLKEGWFFSKPTSEGYYKIVNDSDIEDIAYFSHGLWYKDHLKTDEMYSDEQGVPICWKPVKNK